MVIEKTNWTSITPINIANLQKIEDRIPNAEQTKTDSDKDTYSCNYINQFGEVVLLADSVSGTDTIVTLSDSMNNYRYLCTVGEGYGWTTCKMFPVSIVSTVTGKYYTDTIAENYGINFSRISETQLRVTVGKNLIANAKIFGIK